jgi:hypothetical protein
MVTDDLEMMDFEQIKSILRMREGTKTINTSNQHLFILLTPTPLEEDSNTLIGFILITFSEPGRFQTAAKHMDTSWQRNGLEEWLSDCAKDWTEQNFRNDCQSKDCGAQ